MKTKPTRVFLFDQGMTRSTIDQLPPEDQARLLSLTPEPRRNDIRYSTLAPQRSNGGMGQRGRYTVTGGESW